MKCFSLMIYFFFALNISNNVSIAWGGAPEYIKYYNYKNLDSENPTFDGLNELYDKLMNSKVNYYQRLLLYFVKRILEEKKYKYGHKYTYDRNLKALKDLKAKKNKEGKKLPDEEDNKPEEKSLEERVASIPNEFDCTGLVALIFDQLMGLPYDYKGDQFVLTGEALYNYSKKNLISNNLLLKENLTDLTSEEGYYSKLGYLDDLISMYVEDSKKKAKQLSYFIPLAKKNSGILAQTGDVLGFKDFNKHGEPYFHAQIVIDGCIFVDMSSDTWKNYHKVVMPNGNLGNDGKSIIDAPEKWATHLAMQIRFQEPPGCVDGMWYAIGDGKHKLDSFSMSFRHVFLTLPLLGPIDGNRVENLKYAPEMNPRVEHFEFGDPLS
ncbi:MAG: hypothetical protein QE271_12530 [Bacteriovoracaceae bacterium]|nr:hypothetical protein [Bacteriovoracaceae bacterium]